MAEENQTRWNQLLPKQVDNSFQGYKFTLYFFYLLILVTIVRSCIHIFFPDGGANIIASIDVSVDGGNTIISIFALWGLSQLLFGVFYVIVALRYRSLIPLMFVFILVEYSIRIIVGIFKPVETTRVAPGAIGNLILVPLSLILLIFSLLKPRAQNIVK